MAAMETFEEFQMESSTNSASSVSSHSENTPESDILLPLPPATIGNFDMKDAEQLVANELTRMTLLERERLLNDLHGISDENSPKDPSPEVCAAKLKELDLELKCLSMSMFSSVSVSAYNLASSIDKRYVESERFRLLFLRSHDWNVKKTAVIVAKHFETKLELFGKELLCKNITQDDLDPTSLKLLYCGWLQELPLRDMSNRLVGIMITDPERNIPECKDMDMPVKCKLRRLFYSIMKHSMDDEMHTSRVTIVWMKSTSGMDRGATLRICKMLSCLPNQLAAIHFCIVGEKPNFLHGSVVALAQFAAETFFRVRMKVHFGSPSELKYTLQTYGIPATVLPVGQDGQIQDGLHCQRWSKRRMEERETRKLEEATEKARPTFLIRHGKDSSPDSNHMQEKMESMTPSDTVTTKSDASKNQAQTVNIKGPDEAFHHGSPQVGIPSNGDILLGRGRLSQEHVGNIKFRRLIEENQDAYDAATKREKTKMAAEVVKMVKSQCGRFLKEDGSGWSEVEDSIARTKVANCFRTSRHRRRKVSIAR